MLTSLVGLSASELLSLEVGDVSWRLGEDEILHVFNRLDGFWSYKDGNPYHAELKSGKCSNGFFYSKIVLQYDNLCQIIANQLALRFLQTGFQKPDVIYGIPNGAKELGDYVADALKVRRGTMAKVQGDKLAFVDLPMPGESVLFVEDFCTRATAFRQAEELLLKAEPQADILPFELVILNRGGMKVVETEQAKYGISALVEHRIDDFEPGEKTCKMCAAGSRPIKPKANEENWRLINQV